MKFQFLFIIFFAIGLTKSENLVSNLNIKEKFNNQTNKSWHYKWNENGTAHRIYGNFISKNFNAQNSNESELNARNFIEENNYLFNVNNDDLELWVNDMKGNIRYLIFNQTYQGIPVWDARIDFRYRLNGDLVLLGNDAYSDISISTKPAITMLDATEIAKDHVNYKELKGDYIIEESEQFIWVNKGNNFTFHLVWLVELYVNEINPNKHELPVHRWKVFVDANTGEILNKIDLVQTAIVSGIIEGGVKDEPYGLEFNRPLEHVEVQISGVGSTYTDENGFYSIDIGNSNRTATVRLEGSYLNTNNSSGNDAVITRTVVPGTTENFIFSNGNSIASERDTYYHANLIHDWQKELDPFLTGADYAMPANVNINDNCNAYWDGNSINMYSAGGGCPATGEMADVVYHEYGHGLQQFIYSPYSSPFDSGMGEGCADYWAMTLTNTPCLGQGFFGPGTCLRDGENTRQYPANECGGGVHCLGEMTMGSMWKTRENLINILGYDEGVDRADDLFYFAQTARPNNVPDYLTEILIVDDNDGSIDNGTPYYVSICDAFSEHNIECPISGPLPELEFLPLELSFEISPEEIATENITVVNVGQPGSILNYALGISPFESPSDGPDYNGTFWADSDNEPNLLYDWIDISNSATQYNFSNNDDAGSTISIGFNFEFYGQNYSECIINPNGWVGFGSDNDEWDNAQIPSSSAPSPAIFGFWDDLNPVNDNCNEYCSGNVYYHSNSERMVIWFNEVAHWWTNFENSFYDFQIVLYSTGEVRINYNTMTGNYESGTVGIQNADGTSGFESVFNDNYVHNELAVSFVKGAEWLSTNPNYGELQQGQQDNINVTVDSSDLLSNEYSSFIFINSTGGVGSISVSLIVSGSSLPGDVTGDEVINILDIVTLVNFVVGLSEPESWQFSAGDMNNDDVLNVLDVVLLVNEILTD